MDVAMDKVKGQFDVILPVPIAVSLGFSQQNLGLLQFQIENSDVTIFPPTVEVVDLGDGEAEGRVKKIRVWIVRDAQLESGKQGHWRPTSEEKEKFGRILIGATSRFVTAVKLKTDQWDLDTKRFVRLYKYEYCNADVAVDTTFPLVSEAGEQYELGISSLFFDPDEFHGELTDEIWKEVSGDVQGLVPLPAYEELLYDAKTFCESMRYDTAFLYAALAAELILEQACMNLLKAKGNLTDDQCEEILRGKNIPSKRSLIKKLVKKPEPAFTEPPRLEWLFKTRNKIAHGKLLSVTGEQALEAIKIAKHLKQQLKDQRTVH